MKLMFESKPATKSYISVWNQESFYLYPLRKGLFCLSCDKNNDFFPHASIISSQSMIGRRVAESFSGRVRFSKFRAGLLKYYMLNLISDLFKVPSYEYMCK